MKLFELTPDKALRDALNGVVVVQTSDTDSYAIKAYRQSEMPNTNLDDEFLTVTYNGVVQSMTHPIGVFRGNLAITVYCKANSNGTAKQNRINSILEQMQSLVENKTYGKFHYRFNTDSVITPININETTGYATTVVNVEWHNT